ncbi:MAG: hypothetical protein Ct9H300mP1_38790 [Planctomycetaceae bacterium]|nr:MAG: hypothetical protein Ct9H300mP1_38790 [Planctomycetaceae bacterium]
MSPLRGSFLQADGQALVLGELGQLMWMDLSPKGYKITQRSSLFLARESWCPPVISRGLLYISQNMRDPVTRTGPRLICLTSGGRDPRVPRLTSSQQSGRVDDVVGR